MRSKAERVRIAGDRSEALRGGDCTGPEVPRLVRPKDTLPR
jgi:hypothetical protein